MPGKTSTCAQLLLLCMIVSFFPTIAQADLLDTWHQRNPSPTGEQLRAITFGNNTFVAVGNSGTILTSPDGITWTPRTSGSGDNFRGVTFGNNTFVVVGYSGLTSGTILTSRDGITWTPRMSDTRNWFSGVTFGNNTFVVVGGGWNWTVLTSPDGITWTPRTSGTSSSLSGVAFGNNTFVVVSDSGTILTSRDGITWTPRMSDTRNWFSGVTFGNNTFVVVGTSILGLEPVVDLMGTILTSRDGITWTPRMSGTMKWYLGVAFGNNTFVVVGISIQVEPVVDFAGTILASPDGITWTQRTSGTGNTLYGVTFGKNTFVAVGGYGTILQSALVDVKSTNATVAEFTDTNTIADPPAGFSVHRVVNFTATGVAGSADFSVSFASLPATPVFYKVVGTTWKQLYPRNECSGVTDISLTGTTLRYTIAVTSDCNGTTAPGTIVDPLVAGSNPVLPWPVTGSGDGRGGGQCFIATAAFGSHLHPSVTILRAFRGRILLASSLGSTFVDWYYRISPPIANMVQKSNSLKTGIRILLFPLVGFSFLCLKVGFMWTIALILLCGVVGFLALRRLFPFTRISP